MKCVVLLVPHPQINLNCDPKLDDINEFLSVWEKGTSRHLGTIIVIKTLFKIKSFFMSISNPVQSVINKL